MALVLAIEPDLRQAAIIKRIVRETVHADVVVVDSRDAATEAIRARIPDVLLLSALLLPRDEDELVAHLRTLDGAEHLQTHTIPQLASTAADRGTGRTAKSFLSAFRRKKDPERTAAGCDPDMFADEIRTFLQRAAELKAEAIASLQSRVDRLEYQVQDHAPPADAAPMETGLIFQPDSPKQEIGPEFPQAQAESAWSSPFEWRKATPLRSSEEIDAPPPELRTAAPAPEIWNAAPPALVEARVEPPFPVDSAVYSAEALPTVVEPAIVVVPGTAVVPAIEDPLPAPAAPRWSESPPAAEAAATITEETPPASLAPAVEEVDNIEVPIAAAAPLVPGKRRKRSASILPVSERQPLAPAALLRLMPLAMWARAEARTAEAGGPPAASPRTVNDELHELMSRLAIPLNVACVSYARGCRIRRLRVPGAVEGPRAHAEGAVILSRRMLAEQRNA